MTSIGVPFELAIVASEIGSYKPALGHWRAFEREVGRLPDVHVAVSYFHDVVPASGLGIPTVWINRLAEHARTAADARAARPRAPVRRRSLSSQTDLLRAPAVADAEAIAELYADMRATDTEEVRSWFRNPTFDIERDFRVFERDGAVVGYADVHREEDRLSVDWAARDRTTSEVLLRWAEERAREEAVDRRARLGLAAGMAPRPASCAIAGSGRCARRSRCRSSCRPRPLSPFGRTALPCARCAKAKSRLCTNCSEKRLPTRTISGRPRTTNGRVGRLTRSGSIAISGFSCSRATRPSPLQSASRSGSASRGSAGSSRSQSAAPGGDAVLEERCSCTRFARSTHAGGLPQGSAWTPRIQPAPSDLYESLGMRPVRTRVIYEKPLAV